MKRRFTFLLTALLLFAATGSVWAAVWEKLNETATNVQDGTFKFGWNSAGTYKYKITTPAPDGGYAPGDSETANESAGSDAFAIPLEKYGRVTLLTSPEATIDDGYGIHDRAGFIGDDGHVYYYIVTAIEDNVLSDLLKLRPQEENNYIVLPNSVLTINEQDFTGITGGAEIRIWATKDVAKYPKTGGLGAGTDTVPAGLFKNVKGDITLRLAPVNTANGKNDQGIIAIGKGAFEGFKGKLSISGATGAYGAVTRIGENAFAGVKLGTFDFAEFTGLTKIEAGAFEGAEFSDPTTFTVGDDLTEIGAAAFKGAKKIEIDLSDATNLTKIGADAFAVGTGSSVIGLLGADKLFTISAKGGASFAVVDAVTISAPYTGTEHGEPVAADLIFTKAGAGNITISPTAIEWASSPAPSIVGSSITGAFHITFDGNLAGLSGLFDDHITYTITKANIADLIKTGDFAGKKTTSKGLEKFIGEHLTTLKGLTLDTDYTITAGTITAADDSVAVTVTAASGSRKVTGETPAVIKIALVPDIETALENTSFSNVIISQADANSEEFAALISEIKSILDETSVVGGYEEPTAAYNDGKGKVEVTITGDDEKFTGVKIIDITIEISEISTVVTDDKFTTATISKVEASAKEFAALEGVIKGLLDGIDGVKSHYILGTPAYDKSSSKVSVTVYAASGSDYKGEATIHITAKETPIGEVVDEDFFDGITISAAAADAEDIEVVKSIIQGVLSSEGITLTADDYTVGIPSRIGDKLSVPVEGIGNYTSFVTVILTIEPAVPSAGIHLSLDVDWTATSASAAEVLNEDEAALKALKAKITGTLKVGGKAVPASAYSIIRISGITDGKVDVRIQSESEDYIGVAAVSIPVKPANIGEVAWPSNVDKAGDVKSALAGSTYEDFVLKEGTHYEVETSASDLVAGEKVTATVTAVKGNGFTGSTELVLTVTEKITIEEGKLPSSDLSTTVVTVKTGNDTIPRNFFAGVKGKVFEIVLDPNIKTIEEGAFPAAKNVEKGIDISGLSSPVSVGKNVFAGQTLIVKKDVPLSLSNVGEAAFRDAVFSDSATIQFTSAIKEIPANAFADAKGVKVDFTNATAITSVKANAFKGFDTKSIKGLFSETTANKTLFGIALSSRVPSPLKADEEKKADFTDDALTLKSTYANQKQVPNFKIKNAAGDELKAADYKVTAFKGKASISPSDLIDAGTYALGLEIRGYEGLNEALSDGRISFVIDRYDLADGVILSTGEAFLYTGKTVEPNPNTDFTVKDNYGSTLVLKKDFVLATDADGEVIAYDGNTADAGDLQSIAIAAVKDKDGKFTGNYTGEAKLQFSIAPRPLDKTNIEVINRYYDGKTPVTITSEDILASINGVAYPLSYGTDYEFDGTGAFAGIGTKTIKLAAAEGGNFTGKASVDFSLVGKNITTAVSSKLADKAYTYTGKPVNPLANETLDIKGDLKLGTDYEVVYSTGDLINASKKDITAYVRGIGEWGETAAVRTFSIVPADFNSEGLEIAVSDYTLKKDEDANEAALKSIAKTVTVKLNGVKLSPEDFDITASLVTNRNQAVVEVSPKADNANFTGGTRNKTINIFAYTANEAVAAAKASVSYANGVLTLTNLNGAIATIVSLNGRIAARFAVSGSEVQKGVALAPGFYILSAGNTVTKFIVR
ncbi:hypothetical protein Barb4_00479 [Bacteroidales bacterium Barb4]|nr:hypothetical protein Barb4_00479 [Bacteroidales bacterium Barb4]